MKQSRKIVRQLDEQNAIITIKKYNNDKKKYNNSKKKKISDKNTIISKI